MAKRWVLVALLCALLPIGRSWAHQNHDHVLYVAMYGVDQGTCDNPQAPCRTIMYAINQAKSKGNQVHVAEGSYFFDQREIILLLGRQVTVTGSYSPLQGWTKQMPEEHPTFLVGIHPFYRDQLTLRGFARLEDQPGYEDPYDIAPRPAPQPLQAEQTTITAAMVPCTNGTAVVDARTYECNGIDFMSNVPLNQFVTPGPTVATDGSNLWGHVDLNTNREYALMGVNNGTAVVDVTDPVNPVVVGTVPGIDSIWREVKVYQWWDAKAATWKAYAYISTEANQGMQVIDLNDLPNSVSLATTFTSDFGSSHTVYVNNINNWTNTAMPGKQPLLFMNGTNKNNGRFRVIDINSPMQPFLNTAQPGTQSGYTHDSTSFTISDERAEQCAPGHNPCDIFVDFNVATVDLWDVTDPTNLVFLGNASYPGYGYIHSGWATKDLRYIFVQDEVDELDYGHNGKVRTLDISDLSNPQFVATWTSNVAAIDHNGYTIDDSYYMSHYRRGLTILDITDPLSVTERAFFDTYPGSNNANFNGAWGVYPYLPSGNILVSDIEKGLFVFREAGNDTIGETVTGLEVTGTTPVNVEATATFTATINTGTDVQYIWNWGDGSDPVTGTAEMTHQYLLSGTYTVTVTAENRFNTSTATTEVEVVGVVPVDYKVFLPFLNVFR